VSRGALLEQFSTTTASVGLGVFTEGSSSCVRFVDALPTKGHVYWSLIRFPQRLQRSGLNESSQSGMEVSELCHLAVVSASARHSEQSGTVRGIFHTDCTALFYQTLPWWSQHPSYSQRRAPLETPPTPATFSKFLFYCRGFCVSPASRAQCHTLVRIGSTIKFHLSEWKWFLEISVDVRAFRATVLNLISSPPERGIRT